MFCALKEVHSDLSLYGSSLEVPRNVFACRNSGLPKQGETHTVSSASRGLGIKMSRSHTLSNWNAHRHTKPDRCVRRDRVEQLGVVVVH